MNGMENPKLREKLRTYSVYNSQQYFGYGIAFHTEHIPATLPTHKLVYPLVEIESGSPSDEAGMRNGQRVVGVNGKFVNKEIMTLEDVVQDIEDSYYSRSFTEITVIQPEFWSECMENPRVAQEFTFKKELVQDKSNIANQIIDSVVVTKPVVEAFDRSTPRFIHLERQFRGEQYGFDFKTIKQEGRHVANNVRPDFPADKAGLRNEDIIIEVNGEIIHGMEHDAVIKRISSNPNQVDLLVVADDATYMSMVTKQQPVVKPVQHDEVGIDLRVPSSNVTYHKLQLIPGFKGLGISLTPSGIISFIEPNSPAERAGLRKDHKIVDVNGVDVREKSNKEIASLIKENEGNLIIGVVDTNIDRDVKKVVTNKIVEPQMPSPQLRPYENVTLVSKSQTELNVGSQSVSSATGKQISGTK